METLSERCRRLCGGSHENCFIRNRNQIACIADMVVNKVSGILAVTELAKEERDGEGAKFLSLAIKDIRELINWVKFLQITHDLRMQGSLGREETTSEKRQEMRYPLPEAYREYIAMEMDVAGSFKSVVLLNFSRYGMQFKCPDPLDIDSVIEGVLRCARIIGREVSLKVRIRHCAEQGDEYIIGGKIEEVSDSSAFDFFANVHDFILDSVMKP